MAVLRNILRLAVYINSTVYDINPIPVGGGGGWPGFHTCTFSCVVPNMLISSKKALVTFSRYVLRTPLSENFSRLYRTG